VAVRVILPDRGDTAVNILIVSNQAAGQGDSGLYAFIRELARRRCEVTLRTLSAQTPLDLVLRDADSFDRVVAAGGDGTVASIAYALRDSDVPIVVYPAGTGNLIALNLRMPITPTEVADVTLAGVPLLTDMGEVSCTTPDGMEKRVGFLTSAGAGFDASVMDGARELKPLIGVGAYFVSAMRVLQPTVARFTLGLDGKTVETEGIAVMLVNFAKVLFDLSLTHDSSAHDGELEIVVIRNKSVAGLVPAVWDALLDRLTDGHHDRSKSLEMHRARHVSVSADPPLPMQHNGEIMEADTPFEGHVLPDAVTFVVPAGYLPGQ
jgi:diacylglycerol kinase family enzyme